MEETGRYTVREEIASGSTATVFLAEDKVLRRKVALKKLHPHLLGHAEAVKRFQKEAVAVASLSHENIIRIYDYGNQERNLYLAMEYVDGASLESLLGPMGAPMPGRVCLSVFHQLMRGLVAAHEAGIVHRDIKPSNLLVDRRGRVRIADFGIAFLQQEQSITTTGSYLGTPVYSAPEQARSEPATARSDIFSSGILFYRCLTGSLPFVGENSHVTLSAILEKNPVKAALVNRRVLPGFSELVERMLAKDPQKRPSAAECQAELEAVAVRNGLSIDADRVRRHLEDASGSAAGEGPELSQHFQEMARKAKEAGQTRMAAKLAALAEIHVDPGTAACVVPEENKLGIWCRLPRALAPLLVIGIAGLVLWLVLSGGEPPAEAPAAAPAASVPAPVSVPAPPIEKPSVTEITRVNDPAPATALAAAPRPKPRPPSSRPAARRDEEANRVLAARPRPASVPADVPEAPARPAAPAPAAPQVGFLMVKSNPPFARVSLSGREIGTTPFKSPLLMPTGAHELLLERAGCKPLRTTVRIAAAETALVRLMLDPLAEAP